jgi:hypothetical protein
MSLRDVAQGHLDFNVYFISEWYVKKKWHIEDKRLFDCETVNPLGTAKNVCQCLTKVNSVELNIKKVGALSKSFMSVMHNGRACQCASSRLRGANGLMIQHSS